jgi:hypothetical protein
VTRTSRRIRPRLKWHDTPHWFPYPLAKLTSWLTLWPVKDKERT